MANIKQQIKRNRQNEKRKIYNASFKSSMRSSIKEVIVNVNNNDKEKALLSYNNASKKLDKALAKGIVHKNFVARNKSKLSNLINTLN